MNRTKRPHLAAAVGTAARVFGPARAEDASASPLKVGGAIRCNHVHKNWQDEYSSGDRRLKVDR